VLEEDNLKDFVSGLREIFTVAARQGASANKLPQQLSKPSKPSYLFVKVKKIESSFTREKIQEIYKRFEAISLARSMMYDLSRRFVRDRNGSYNREIHIEYLDKAPAGFSMNAGDVTLLDAAGVDISFEVMAQRKSVEEVKVFVVRIIFTQPLYDWRDAESAARFLPSEWPGIGTARNIKYKLADGESEMAVVLYHELLHVWYFWYGKDRSMFPSGHGDAAIGEIADDYYSYLERFYRQMEALEDKIHALQTLIEYLKTLPSGTSALLAPGLNQALADVLSGDANVGLATCGRIDAFVENAKTLHKNDKLTQEQMAEILSLVENAKNELGSRK
jgi:hypothetical protein